MVSSPLGPSIFTSTNSSKTIAEYGFDDRRSSVPVAIDCITTASSKSFLQTENVRGTLGSPMVTLVPVGLCMLAPQIEVRIVCSKPIVFIDAGFTKPAHWNGLPIWSCSSIMSTLFPCSLNLRERYPPIGPAPTTTTSNSRIIIFPSNTIFCFCAWNLLFS